MTTPYFYIIKHTRSGKQYAGARYGKGCDPSELLQPTGYNTSCRPIQDMLKQGETFEIVSVRTEAELGMPPLQYETQFLQEHNIAEDPNWINSHNNEYATTHTSSKFKTNMLAKHGVEFALQSPVILQKMQQRLLEETGCINQFQLPDVKLKSRRTLIEKTGYEYTSQDPNTKNKKRLTNMEKRGVAHSLQSTEVRERGKQTLLDTLGVDNAMKSKAVQEKAKRTRLAKTGYAHALQDPTVVEKIKQDRITRTGYDHPSKNPAVLEQRRITKQLKSARPIVVELKSLLKQLRVSGKSVGLLPNWIYGPNNQLETAALRLRSLLTTLT